MPPRKSSAPHHAKRPRIHNSKPHLPSKPPPQTIIAAPAPLKTTIPFLPTDHILLVGEGDFSFAHSLLHHHAFTSLVATSLDSRDVVLEKYPHARELLRGLEGWGVVDGGGGGGQDGEGEEEEENGEGDEEKEEEEKKDEEEDQDTEKTKPVKKEVRVRFGVDATKLTRAKVLGRKKPKKKKKEEPEPGFDKIVFNFPHVGGKTKDVNRQVRYNQDLLVQFFTTALPLLAPSGSILITLFEGQPYQLWNIRDLARHVGLQVGRSFRFEAGAYPGYRHARTVGRIEGRRGGGGGGEGGEEGEGEKGEGMEEERRGWRGEERAARMYIFEVVGERDRRGLVGKKKRKRGRGSEDDDDDDDEED